jgi:hypothetical protein
MPPGELAERQEVAIAARATAVSRATGRTQDTMAYDRKETRRGI